VALWYLEITHTRNVVNCTELVNGVLGKVGRQMKLALAMLCIYPDRICLLDEWIPVMGNAFPVSVDEKASQLAV
jgi:hypothetical protein